MLGRVIRTDKSVVGQDLVRTASCEHCRFNPCSPFVLAQAVHAVFAALILSAVSLPLSLGGSHPWAVKKLVQAAAFPATYATLIVKKFSVYKRDRQGE